MGKWLKLENYKMIYKLVFLCTIIGLVTQVTLGIISLNILQDALNSAQANPVTPEFIQSEIKNFLVIFVISWVVLSCFGLLVSYVLSRMLVDPLKKILKIVHRAEKGDLTARVNVHGEDEISQLAQSFDVMLNSFNKLVGRVNQATRLVSDSSDGLHQAALETQKVIGQVAAGIESLASNTGTQNNSIDTMMDNVQRLNQAILQINQGAQEQVNDVSETSKSIEDMAKSIETIKANIEQVIQSSSKTAKVAEHGESTVRDTIEGMDRVRNTVLQSAERVKELGHYSHQIGEMVDLISTIAEQTNLLALNAAIEAARAGEQGKGFAVVADEVRKLADATNKSAHEIGTIIGETQRVMDEVVQVMEVGTQEAEEGSRLASGAGQALQEILTNVGETNREIKAIDVAVKEIVNNSDVVVEAIQGVSAVTDENTSVTEEMSRNSSKVLTAIDTLVGSIHETSAFAEEVAASTTQMNISAEDIAGHVEKLRDMVLQLQDEVEKFKV